jgi:hypothetical protein
MNTVFSSEEAYLIGMKLGVDFTQFSIDEFRKGLQVEMSKELEANGMHLINTNPYLAGSIVRNHLHELPDYYSHLYRTIEEKK